MRRFELETAIRRAKPYKKLAQATLEHKTVPNRLNRLFNQEEPGKVLLTDITYVYYGTGQPAYLSCVKDAATREIIAYCLSKTLKMELVYKTLEKLSDFMTVSNECSHITNANINCHRRKLFIMKHISYISLNPP